MTIRQFDVETAYLNSELEERVYMETPKSIDSILQDIVDSESDTFIKTKATDMLNEVRKGDKVCLLKKSLYGLRQAGRSWHRKLSATLMELGASPSKSDPCLYLVGSGKDLMLITIYVDDLLIAARNERPIIEFGKKLAKRFTMKDLGKARYCLGIEIGQEDGKVSMHQRGYTREILDRFGMSDCKPVTTPMDIGAKLKKNETPNEDDLKLPYRELVGAITYLSSTTRPDIAFAVSYLGQFNNCFGSEHWKAAKRVLRYLRGTLDLGLVFKSNSDLIKEFVDADWGSCCDDRRSYTGYIFLFNGCPVSWDAKKQPTVALSTTEAEYMALTECAKESIYLRRFLRELGFYSSAHIVVYCDNRSGLKLAENPVFHSRSKHIDLRHHFIRDAIQNDQLIVEYIPSEQQIADFLTKGLPRPKHVRCVTSAGMGIIKENLKRS